MTLLGKLASDEVIDEAYRWLCKRRRHFPANADIWSFRFAWPAEKATLRSELLTARYRFAPLRRVVNQDGEVIHIWSARDALVLKALALVLADVLPVSKRCVPVKGHGGAKAAARAVRDNLSSHTFVCRTDVSSYYDSVDHFELLDQLAR